MSSPLRFELELVAGSICPATAQDFAEATGRTRASIYPHLQAMVDAGFLVVAGHRPSARRPVAIYDRGPMMDVPPYDVEHTADGRPLIPHYRAWQPRASAAASGGAWVDYRYEVLGPYAALLVKQPQDGGPADA